MMYVWLMARILVLLFMGGVALVAQQPEFEVASIRKSQSITPDLIASGLRIGMKVENGRVDIGFVTMKGLLMYAFEAKEFQIAGPEWMEQRFDIVAKMPEGSTREQVPGMLRRLLEERFQMKVHKESRDQPVYTLTQAKSGIKFKQAAPEPIKVEEPRIAGVGPTTVKRTADGDVTQGSSTGALRRTFGPNGIHLEWDRITLQAFADMLSTMLGTQVIDKTRLTGTYQLGFDMTTPEAVQAAKSRRTETEPVAAPSQDNGESRASDPVGNIIQSVQPLGLRLEKGTAPIDYFVVDHLEKSPTEN